MNYDFMIDLVGKENREVIQNYVKEFYNNDFELSQIVLFLNLLIHREDNCQT